LYVVIAVDPTLVGSTLIHFPFLSVPLVRGKIPALPVLTPGFFHHPEDLSRFGAYEDGSSSSRLVGLPSLITPSLIMTIQSDFAMFILIAFHPTVKLS
jgi:hypothetical protein